MDIVDGDEVEPTLTEVAFDHLNSYNNASVVNAYCLTGIQAKAFHARIAPHADALISLSCPGPAPLWAGDKPGEPMARRPTGDAIFNYANSMLFAPSVTIPLISLAGMPVGAQLIGQQHEDARLTSYAR